VKGGDRTSSRRVAGPACAVTTRPTQGGGGGWRGPSTPDSRPGLWPGFRGLAPWPERGAWIPSGLERSGWLDAPPFEGEAPGGIHFGAGSSHRSGSVIAMKRFLSLPSTVIRGVLAPPMSSGRPQGSHASQVLVAFGCRGASLPRRAAPSQAAAFDHAVRSSTAVLTPSKGRVAA